MPRAGRGGLLVRWLAVQQREHEGRAELVIGRQGSTNIMMKGEFYCMLDKLPRKLLPHILDPACKP